MSHNDAVHLVNLPCKMQSNSNKHRGSALVIAIFVIIVMSLLGAALVKMMDSSHENVAFEVLGTRAYAAAQSGLQWQLSRLFPLGEDAVTCQTQQDINDNLPSFAVTDGLNQCSVSITCTSFDREGVNYYTVTSVGECQLDSEVTSRIIEVEARSL